MPQNVLRHPLLYFLVFVNQSKHLRNQTRRRNTYRAAQQLCRTATIKHDSARIRIVRISRSVSKPESSHDTSDSQETVLPEYEVGYIPDGYEENQVLETHTGKTIIFSNGRDMIFINWYLLSDNMNVEARAVDAELIPDKVNDHDAEWIVPNDSSQTTDLLWTDDRRGVGFIVSGYLERAELLKIAESISCT